MPSKLDDPVWRQERARKGGQAANTTDALIRTLVKRAPELTEDNKAALRALLADSDGSGAGA